MRYIVGNWWARGYLILVALTALFVVWSLATWDQPDANLAAIWLFVVTAPLSFVLIGVLSPIIDNTGGFIAYIVVCALANAAALSALGRLGSRRRERRNPAT
jgi:hypothetical protein